MDLKEWPETECSVWESTGLPHNSAVNQGGCGRLRQQDVGVHEQPGVSEVHPESVSVAVVTQKTCSSAAD